MRACADLAERARARRDDPRPEPPRPPLRELPAWAGADGQRPVYRPSVRRRDPGRPRHLGRRADPAGRGQRPRRLGRGRQAWESLGCPHRAGYAWWRQAEAQLDAGQPARGGHPRCGPRRPPPTATRRCSPRSARWPSGPASPCRLPGRPRRRTRARPRQPAPYGLTGRELAVLRLLAAGRTNAQIGAELYISPKTASVHVTSILRKLGVSSRVQAAALAERAGLLDTRPP